ncbi:MAG: hypothetical protein MZV63_72415 [Marinilabiliales bacterium]|nr:hypothetical protein [Marinilabiliales bacterium]
MKPMPGKDFEQQVRETMGPWRLEPSGEVWGSLRLAFSERKSAGVQSIFSCWQAW